MVVVVVITLIVIVVTEVGDKELLRVFVLLVK